MAKIMWCLEHEEDVMVFGDFHVVWYDYDCNGPFFTSHPPEDLQDAWQDELVEPSEEELQEMDAGAELFLWDLGLAEK